MEIVWNGNVNKVPFEYVDIGHTFMHNGDIYMRITNVYDADKNIVVNAVSIANGIVVTFYDDEYVTPVVGKFVMD